MTHSARWRGGSYVPRWSINPMTCVHKEHEHTKQTETCTGQAMDVLSWSWPAHHCSFELDRLVAKRCWVPSNMWAFFNPLQPVTSHDPIIKKSTPDFTLSCFHSCIQHEPVFSYILCTSTYIKKDGVHIQAFLSWNTENLYADFMTTFSSTFGRTWSFMRQYETS